MWGVRMAGGIRKLAWYERVMSVAVLDRLSILSVVSVAASGTRSRLLSVVELKSLKLERR